MTKIPRWQTPERRAYMQAYRAAHPRTRANPNLKPIPPTYRCFDCGMRWQQHHGYCRACGRKRGIVKLTPRELDRQRRSVAPQRVEIIASARPTRMIDGTEYEVVFP